MQPKCGKRLENYKAKTIESNKEKKPRTYTKIEAKKIKSDNFRGSNKGQSNIDIPILKNKTIKAQK